MIKTESENLKRLREILKEIEVQDFNFTQDQEKEYQKMTLDIDHLIHEEISKINCETNKECKLKSYETLFNSIIYLIENKKAII